MADLEAQIPQQIEHVLDHALAPRRLLVGQQEQQIDVGEGRQQAAAVAAGGDDGHALGVGRIGGAIDVGDRVVVDQADQLVLERRQARGAAPPVAVGLELPLAAASRAPSTQRLQAVEHLRPRSAPLAVRAEMRRQLATRSRGRRNRAAVIMLCPLRRAVQVTAGFRL